MAKLGEVYQEQVGPGGPLGIREDATTRGAEALEQFGETIGQVQQAVYERQRRTEYNDAIQEAVREFNQLDEKVALNPNYSQWTEEFTKGAQEVYARVAGKMQNKQALEQFADWTTSNAEAKRHAYAQAAQQKKLQFDRQIFNDNFEGAVTSGRGDIAGDLLDSAKEAGVISDVEYEQLLQNAEKRMVYDDAKDTLLTTGDITEAMQLITDPEKSPTLSDGDRDELKDRLEREWEILKRQQLEQRRTVYNDAYNDYLSRYQQGTLDEDYIFADPRSEHFDGAQFRLREMALGWLRAKGSGTGEAPPAVESQSWGVFVQPFLTEREKKDQLRTILADYPETLAKFLAKDFSQPQDESISTGLERLDIEFDRRQAAAGNNPDKKAQVEQDRLAHTQYLMDEVERMGIPRTDPRFADAVRAKVDKIMGKVLAGSINANFRERDVKFEDIFPGQNELEKVLEAAQTGQLLLSRDVDTVLKLGEATGQLLERAFGVPPDPYSNYELDPPIENGRYVLDDGRTGFLINQELYTIEYDAVAKNERIVKWDGRKWNPAEITPEMQARMYPGREAVRALQENRGRPTAAAVQQSAEEAGFTAPPATTRGGAAAFTQPPEERPKTYQEMELPELEEALKNERLRGRGASVQRIREIQAEIDKKATR